MHSSSESISSAIVIKDLRKTYPATKKNPEKEALKGVSLEIARGSIFGLLGPNGAGKSTIINIMAGLTLKTSGHVSIWGHDIDNERIAATRNIGIVPQELVVDTFFSVREALEFQAGYYGIDKPDRKTMDIISHMGLLEQADINPRRLSGGMKRRLLVGKALVHSPPILVLDEPTAGVDVELRRQLWDYVKSLNEMGTTVLLTTHYLEEAEELCDNLAIINHGEVVANDTKSNLMALFDNKRIKISVEQSLASGLPSTLVSFGAVIEDGALVFNYSPSKTGVAEILAVVCESGFNIRDISTVETNLEEVFTNLVSGR
jgi:ABC-2 type transport system ATP-binding protein